MTERQYWKVRVVRNGVVIAWRIAPTELAQQYANVLRLLYPNDQIRADRVSDNEAAYPPEQPYDPRD